MISPGILELSKTALASGDSRMVETIGFHVLLDFDRATLAHCRETVHGCSIAKITVDRTAASGAIEVDGRDLKFRLWPSMEYMDVQLAVDVLAEQPGPTRVVLVTGDSDFVPLVTLLKSRQVRGEAAMFKARTARELVNVVDHFWPLDEDVLL